MSRVYPIYVPRWSLPKHKFIPQIVGAIARSPQNFIRFPRAGAQCTPLRDCAKPMILYEINLAWDAAPTRTEEQHKKRKNPRRRSTGVLEGYQTNLPLCLLTTSNTRGIQGMYPCLVRIEYHPIIANCIQKYEQFVNKFCKNQLYLTKYAEDCRKDETICGFLLDTA